MAIAFQTAGTAAVGTTSLSVPYPSGITAGDMLVLSIASKYTPNVPSLPSGWISGLSNNQVSGSNGANGIDTGSATATVFLKIANGTETGNLAVTVTSGNSCIGRMFRYSKAAAASWDYAFVNGADSTAGTAWSITGNTTLSAIGGDMILATSGINTDGYTYSAQAVTMTGITFGTAVERQDSGTTQGQDCGLVMSEHPVSSGSATVTPTYTMTASSSATNAPAGGTVILRLREVLTLQAENTWKQTGSDLSVTTTYPAACPLGTNQVIFYENATLALYTWGGSSFSQTTSTTVTSGGRGGVAKLSSTTFALVADGINQLRTYIYSGGTLSQVGNSLSLGTVNDPTVCSLSATRVVVADDSSAGGGSASVRVFDWNGTNWTQVGNTYTTDGFGLANKAVSLGADTFAIHDGDSGNLNTYYFDGTNITRIHQFSLTFCPVGMEATSSNTIAHTENCGDTIRLRSFNGSTWTQVGTNVTIASHVYAALAKMSDRYMAVFIGTSNVLRMYEMPVNYGMGTPAATFSVGTVPGPGTPRFYASVWGG